MTQGRRRPQHRSSSPRRPREGPAGARPRRGTRPLPPAGPRPHRAPAGRRRQRGPPSPATQPQRVLWPRPLQAQASTSRPRPHWPAQPGGRSPPPPALRERARARARRPLAVGSARHSPHPLGRAGLGTLSGLPASMRSTAAVAGVETFLGQTPLLRVFCLRRAAGGLTNPRWGEGPELAKEAGQDQDWAAATGAERRSVGLVGWTGSWAGRSQTREWGLR